MLSTPPMASVVDVIAMKNAQVITGELALCRSNLVSGTAQAVR
jgi:hypothetical protein